MFGGLIGGSSPLARGTLHLVDERVDRVRFIPARAGNTNPGVSGAEPLTVHPRSRGEHYGGGPCWIGVDGSSPLARGTLGVFLPQLPQRRFIPARAGNTKLRLHRGILASVHPRSRGEHSSRNLLIEMVFFDDKERTDYSTLNSEDREAARLPPRSAVRFRSGHHRMSA